MDKTENKSSITFLASFPQIQSAIKRGNEGMRIQLDVPESEVVNAVPLLALMDQTFRVVITLATTKNETWTNLDDETNEEAETKRPRLDRRRHRD
jgi:hypothetical protein